MILEKRLIVVEGINGTAKTTLIKSIKNPNVETIKLPNDPDLIEKINTYKHTKRDIFEGTLDIKYNNAVAFTFLVDQLIAEADIIKKLEEDPNKFIVCDRSWISNLAYSKTLYGVDYEGILTAVLSSCTIPKHVIYLMAPPKTCTERITERAKEDTKIKENNNQTEKILNNYLETFNKLKNYGVRIHEFSTLGSFNDTIERFNELVNTFIFSYGLHI